MTETETTRLSVNMNAELNSQQPSVERSKSKVWTDRLKGSAKILFAIGIIVFMAKQGLLNFEQLKMLFEPLVFTVGLLLIGANFFLVAWRFRILLLAENLKMSLWEANQFTLIGGFFNFAIVGGVGGDLVKGYMLAKKFPRSKMAAALCVLMDRVIGLFTMVLMAFSVMVFDFRRVWGTMQLRAFFIFLSIVFFGFIIFLSFAFSNRLKKSPWIFWFLNRLPMSHHFISLYDSIMAYGDRKLDFLKAMSVSVLAQLSSIALLAWAGHSLGFTEVPLTTYFIGGPLGFMAVAIPISPAGIGVGQAAFYFIFNLYIGHKSEVGPAVITAFQMFSLVVGLLGGLIYLNYKGEKKA